MVVKNEINDLVESLRLKTENCYKNRMMCCSESILYTFNQGLQGGLPDKKAIGMGSGLCGGIGGNEICGALNGAILAIEILLKSVPSDGTKETIMAATTALRKSFKEQFKFEKCKNLIKNNNDKSRRCYCQNITGVSAEIVARIILQYRPELLASSNQNFLRNHDSKLSGLLKKILSFE